MREGLDMIQIHLIKSVLIFVGTCYLIPMLYEFVSLLYFRFLIFLEFTFMYMHDVFSVLSSDFYFYYIVFESYLLALFGRNIIF